jgi:hypothetical protein
VSIVATLMIINKLVMKKYLFHFVTRFQINANAFQQETKIQIKVDKFDGHFFTPERYDFANEVILNITSYFYTKKSISTKLKNILIRLIDDSEQDKNNEYDEDIMYHNIEINTSSIKINTNTEYHKRLYLYQFYLRIIEKIVFKLKEYGNVVNGHTTIIWDMSEDEGGSYTGLMNIIVKDNLITASTLSRNKGSECWEETSQHALEEEIIYQNKSNILHNKMKKLSKKNYKKVSDFIKTLT